MTSPIPRDRELLSGASSALDEAVSMSGLEPSEDVRLRLLEAAAAYVGGYSLEEFDLTVGDDSQDESLSADAAMALAWKLAQAVSESPIPPSLVLAAIGDSEVDGVIRRRQGQYFTDSRLALSLTSGIQEKIVQARSILDPSCGAGVLLVAAALNAGTRSEHRAHLVRHVLWGVDRDRRAVRAARAALSSLTDDLSAVDGLCKRLLVADSLIAGTEWWRARSHKGFDLVVGNPPWEKLKVTRHEHVLSGGHQRYYGDDYQLSEFDEDALRADRVSVVAYRDAANAELHYQGPGECDLYKMFVELGARLTSESGALAFLVPAGLIRNYGASTLRDWLFRNFDVDILIRDNRERYFEIDSRFKFIELLATRSDRKDRTVRFGSASAGSWKGKASFADLKRLDPGLSIPEVRERGDWDLYTRLRRKHPQFGSVEAGWRPRFHREVDMTGDRAMFKDVASGSGDVSLIEGRMVHQHRVLAKRYVAGRGRRAEWEVQPQFDAALQPQWLVNYADLRTELQERVDKPRAGFCDITGQTNERTVLAALIPSGVVCGNKVPTIDFAYDIQAAAWVGIANSFAFDWLARRSVTTTLNFFIVRSLPIPAWDVGQPSYLAIGELTRLLSRLEGDRGEEDLWDVARIRARIEVLSACLYGISVKDLDQMMRDFPQVDRAQSPVPGELVSSVTRDTIVASGDGWATPAELEHAQDRVRLAQSVGAIPFIPNQHARYFRKQS